MVVATSSEFRLANLTFGQRLRWQAPSRLHWLTLQHSPFHSFACYNLGRHGSNSQSGYGKMILFESLRWRYVINSKRRSAICEVSHSGPVQDTQPAIAKSWVESEKIHVDDGDGKTSRNLSWSCWKPWFPVGFPIEPIRDRQRLYRCTPTSWLNLRPLEQRRFLFKISVGGFFLFGFTWFYSPIYLGWIIWIGIITMMGNPMNTYEPGHLHNRNTPYLSIWAPEDYLLPLKLMWSQRCRGDQQQRGSWWRTADSVGQCLGIWEPQRKFDGNPSGIRVPNIGRDVPELTMMSCIELVEFQIY